MGRGGSTGPNALLYAGIDARRRQMLQHGHELIGQALELATRIRKAIEAIDGFHVNDAKDFRGLGLAAVSTTGAPARSSPAPTTPDAADRRLNTVRVVAER